MWNFNKNDKKWSSQDDRLKRDSFDTYKQELESVRFYSKCLSGATYLPINDLNNIYDIISSNIPRNWYISNQGSTHSNSPIPTYKPSAITTSNSSDYYGKFNSEYGLTLKNKFTPDKLINDSLKNYLEVDVATTEQLPNLNQTNIDGVKLLKGHRVLVKDQKIRTTISISTNPDTFFDGSYVVINNYGSTVEYETFSDTNGIYLYDGSTLVKQDDLDDYSSAQRYSVSVKLGNINKDKQYKLSRLRSGYFPIGQSTEFVPTKNWLLRNRVDYNNILDINYYDVIKHDEQTYILDNIEYVIPERIISIGEFGFIINNQSGISNIIDNKYKKNLRSIGQTNMYYWFAGDDGILLKVRKHDFLVKRIDVDCKNGNLIANLKSIDFYNDLNGVIVGDRNTILITSDGGNSWKRIKIDAFVSYNFNKVVYKKADKFYIGGDNGIFIEFGRDMNEWVAFRRRISKFEDELDDYILVDNINDMIYCNIDNWSVDFVYPVGSAAPIGVNKEVLFIVCDNNKIIMHDINGSFPFHTQFFYFAISNNLGDIKNIILKEGKDVYITTTKGLYKFVLDLYDQINYKDDLSNLIYPTSGLVGVVIDTSGSIISLSDLYNNSIFNYKDLELLIAGNNSLLSSSFFNTIMDFDDIDDTLYDRLTPRLLFTDYDIGSKLNFFTDGGDYRLPNSINFPLGSIEFKPLPGETNWFDYWSDRKVQYELFEPVSDLTEIKMNSFFKYEVSTSVVLNPVDIDIEFGLSDKESRYSGSVSPTNELYLNDYLMCFKSSDFDLGDILRLESDVLSDNFIVNKIVGNYVYVITEFNQNIIKSLSNSVITITNLNKFSNAQELLDRFDKHDISIGYELSLLPDEIIKIDAKFNNLTSYYNLATNVICASTFDMSYDDSFLKFGYTPTYNILDYLNTIDDSIFKTDKEYLVMPHYDGIELDSIDDNKLYFKSINEFEWNSIFINTFIDIDTEKKLLVVKKYKEDSKFVIELHRKVNLTNTVNIKSRRTLELISEDLQELNNIQRPENNINGFDRYERLLNFKINTDSYTKILLSDLQTFESLTGIVYIDVKNELSLNITKLEREKTIPIVNIFDFGGKVLVRCSSPHELRDGDGVILEFDETVDSSYLGYRVVEAVVGNSLEFLIDVDFVLDNSGLNKTGKVRYIRRDPFLNYEPVDIIDIGTDKRGTRSIELSSENTSLNGYEISLIDVDFEKYRFRLVDGLDVEKLALDYGWVYEAEISNAVIGLTNDMLTWYSGVWECGRWFGGRWISGIWKSGDWYSGIWESKMIKDNWINVEIDNKSSNSTSSTWINGRWYDGIWNNGTWNNGRWYGGVWENGLWYNGTWNDGTWNNGSFTGGIWILGSWKRGKFNTENGSSYWIDGSWHGGDFENGMWYGGVFDQKEQESRFGTKSYNSRTATWHSGTWVNGSFHSRLNVDSDGNYIRSLTNKYSIWKTGDWYNGDWYGGICYNIDFKSGTWHGGILEDIQIVGFNQNDVDDVVYDNEIIINGIFKFDIGDEITVIDDNRNNMYSIYGSNSNPIRYTILYYKELDNNRTALFVDKTIAINASDRDTGLRIVSTYRNCNWKSGIWTNGIYEKGLWEGGIFYNGIFKGTWM